MQQNATAAGAPLRTLLGELTALHRPIAGFKGAASGRGGGGRREGREREERGRKGGKGRRGEVNSDAQLEQLIG